MRLFLRFFPLYLVIFIGFLGYSMTLPLFTTMVMEGSDPIIPQALSEAERTILLGFLLMVYPLGQFFGSPILGALSDRYGRKRVLVISLLLSSIFYVGIALSLTLYHLSFLFLSLFLAGLSEGNIALAQSAIADAVVGHERRSAFGLIYTVACLAYIAGPLLGGIFSSASIVSWFDYSTPFWIALLFLIATLLWIAKSMEQSKGSHQLRLKDAFTNLRTLFTDRRLRPYYLINFFIYMAIFGFFRAFPMYAVDRFETPTLRLSIFIAYVSVPLFIANTVIVPRIPHSWNPRRLASTTALLMAISLVIVVLPNSEKSFWITLPPASFFLALCITEVATLISHRAKPGTLGRVMGNNQSLQVGAEALSASLAGFVAAIGVALPFLIFALMGALGGLLLLRRKE